MAARLYLPPFQILQNNLFAYELVPNYKCFKDKYEKIVGGGIMCKKKKLDLNDELKENVKDIGIITFEEVANCLWEDVPYIVKIGKNLLSLPHLIHQEIFWNKFTKFVSGIKSDPAFEAKFATKIANAEDRSEYARRIITILEKIEEEQKVDYIINATRALCWDQIDRSLYFRICRAIENVYIDDLKFVFDNYDVKEYFPEDIAVAELTSHGLMRQEIIDGGTADPNYVAKTHVFTELGKLVYDMALNYERPDLLQ